MKGTSRFMELEPPHRLRLRLVAPKTPIRSGLTWDFEDTPDGCRFTYGFTTEAPRGLGWAAAVMLGMATKGMPEKLEALPSRYA